MTIITAADRLSASAAPHRQAKALPAPDQPFSAGLTEADATADAPKSTFPVNTLGGGTVAGGRWVGGLAEVSLIAASTTTNKAANSVDSTAPDPASTPSNAVGEAGNFCRADNFSGVLKEKTAAFAETLDRRFALAGVDTRIPVQMDVTSDGTIVVRGDHPDKAKIERLFAEDPDLANEYRGIASAHAFNAHGKLAVRYAVDLDEAKGEKERERVFRRYERLFQQIERAGGQMTLSGRQLSSGAMDMAAALTQMPSWALGV